LEDIDNLLAFGRMAFDLGQYEQARGYYEQALALDASNQEAMNGLAQVNEALSHREPAAPMEAETQPQASLGIVEWIRKKRKEHAERVAEAERLAAEEREKRAKEIAVLRRVWAEKRAQLGDVPLQVGQCPECGSKDSYCYKTLCLLGCRVMIATFPFSLLAYPFLPEECHCRVCGAKWRIKNSKIFQNKIA